MGSIRENGFAPIEQARVRRHANLCAYPGLLFSRLVLKLWDHPVPANRGKCTMAKRPTSSYPSTRREFTLGLSAALLAASSRGSSAAEPPKPAQIVVNDSGGAMANWMR